MLSSYINKLLNGRHLSEKEAEEAMDILIEGSPHQTQVGAFLALLNAAGETASEIAGMGRSLRSHAREVDFGVEGVDTCGTGGDGMHTINISTGAALLIAAAGVPVLKHGNRSITSKCGSADVLEALGIVIESNIRELREMLDETGFVFLFAPNFHPALAQFSEARRKLGIRTVFNILGPLSNPAFVKRQVVGVFSRDLLEPMAEAFLSIGGEHALFFSGYKGLDELTTLGRTVVVEAKEGFVERYELCGTDFGLREASLDDLQGGNTKENADALVSILSGEDSPRADSVIFSAAAALHVFMDCSLEESVGIAKKVQKSGAALDIVEKLQAFSREHRHA